MDWESVSEALYDVLNIYYFVDGHALNDRPRLAKVTHDCLIKEVGSDDDDDANENNNNIMSEEDILEFLNGSEGRKEIDQALYALNEMGVHGIPKFIIEGKRVVDGAAHSNTFIDIFREIEEKGAVHAGPVFGEILGVASEIIKKGSHSNSSA